VETPATADPSGSTRAGRRFRSPRARLAGPAAAALVITAAVLLFSEGWLHGDLVIDGPGSSIFVEVALRHLRDLHFIPYWEPQMWSGTPVWAVIPHLASVPVVPLAAVLGVDRAVQVASLAGQIVGGLGAYALARSLWGDRVAALVAGVLYSVSPVMTSNAGIGTESVVWVLALIPWFVFSVLLSVRVGRPHHLAAAALTGAVMVASQAEHAYGIALLVLVLLPLEVARARRIDDGPSIRAVCRRLAVIAVLGLGLLAHVLLPLISARGWFFLSPESLIQGALHEGLAAEIGRDLGLFLSRPHGSAAFGTTKSFLQIGALYLGFVAVVLSSVTIWLLARHDRRGEMSGALSAAWLAVWVSTAGTALAHGTLAGANGAVWAIGGFLAGVLGTSYIGALRLGRRVSLAATGLLVLFLAAAPYLRPFLWLRRFAPFFESIRISRLFTVAGLALALSSAFLVAVAGRRDRGFARLSPNAFQVTVALAICLAILVDLWPLRDHYRGIQYRLRPAARAIAALAVDRDHPRIASNDLGDPAPFLAALRAGRSMSTGWPHFIAGRDMWNATGGVVLLPEGMRDRRLALAATSHVIDPASIDARRHVRTAPPPPLITRVAEPLGMVRAYSEVVVTSGEGPDVDLAAALAGRGIGVVSGAATPGLGAMPRQDVHWPAACSMGMPEGSPLAGAVARSCSEAVWSQRLEGIAFRQITPDATIGATFHSSADGLSGVAVRSTVAKGNSLRLHEMRGNVVGRQVALSSSPSPPLRHQEGMVRYAFPAIADSRGHDYAFFLACSMCPGSEGPNLAVAKTSDATGNVIEDGVLDKGVVAEFTLEYPEPATLAAGTTVSAHSPEPGAWDVSSSGRRPALVVVAEAWFPGWTATLDGVRVPVRRSDGAFVGVMVPAGDHQVALRYRRPRAFDIGLATSAATLLAIGGWLLTSWLITPALVRRRRRRASPRN
jgi:hypothetical protein